MWLFLPRLAQAAGARRGVIRGRTAAWTSRGRSSTKLTVAGLPAGKGCAGVCGWGAPGFFLVPVTLEWQKRDTLLFY